MATKKRISRIDRGLAAFSPFAMSVQDENEFDNAFVLDKEESDTELYDDTEINEKTLLTLVDDINISKTKFAERMIALFQLSDPMKVLKYSMHKLQETEEQYEEEIEARDIAISIIKPPSRLTDEDYRSRKIIRNSLWAKIMPTEILKLIFTLSVTNFDSYDNTVLQLILVCKDWRMTVLKYEHDEKFQDVLWYPLLNKFERGPAMDWRHLVLIPDKYLKLLYNARYRAMTTEECKEYDELIGVQHDDCCLNASTNIPLLIAIMQKCPRLYSLYLFGDLCEDLFFVIGDTQKGLGNITFDCTTNAESAWLHHIMYRGSAVCKSLQSISVERSYWFDNEGCFFLSKCENIRSLEMEKPYISEEGLEAIFESCTKLLRIQIHKGYFEEILEALRLLAENNEVIQKIELDFTGWAQEQGLNDDEYLDVFMDPRACPKLRYLSLSCGFSHETIQEFMNRRPNVKLHTL